MRIRRQSVPAEIPTASMADVAFLLIIFFLVTSFYSVTRGIQFSLPRHEEEALTARPEAAVHVVIAADGSVTADRNAMTLDELQQYVGSRVARNPDKAVILQTSLQAPYGAMTDVFDELQQAGVRTLVIPTSAQLSLYGLAPVP